MATGISTNRSELQAGNPLGNWVFTSNYKLFKIKPGGYFTTQARANTFGYSVMDALQPNWACFPSKRYGVNYAYVLVDGNRWDAASMKRVLDEQAYFASQGDTSFTVEEATGCWNDGSDILWDETQYYKFYDQTYSYFDSNSEFHDSGTGDSSVMRLDEAVWENTTTSDYAHIREWKQLIAAGQNWNGGNWRDGTGREANFPYDLPLTNSNIALIGFDHDTVNQSVISDTSNAYYDINSNFERLLAEAQPLAYSWVYEDQNGVGTEETLAMFVDLTIFDPYDFTKGLNAVADATGDTYLFPTTLDFVWSGGTDTD
jgi:hypothetical protein